jgi:hypothetical protein
MADHSSATTSPPALVVSAGTIAMTTSRSMSMKAERLTCRLLAIEDIFHSNANTTNRQFLGANAVVFEVDGNARLEWSCLLD